MLQFPLAFTKTAFKTLQVIVTLYYIEHETLMITGKGRSSRPEVFCEKVVLRNFTNSQENT